jgi:DNA-binding LytR/AlgR family response regulator
MKDTLTCIIIDDDDLDRMAVEAELSNFLNIKTLGSYNNPIEAIGAIQGQKPDILFLDIDMPEINGLTLIKTIADLNLITVIISSHPEYALEGFQLKVFDFILKPIEENRFLNCYHRITEFKQLQAKAEAYDVLFDNEKVIFKEGYNLITLSTHEILFLEAFGDYTKIVTAEKSHLTLTTLANFLNSLPKGKFLRVHRSYVIAISKMNSFSSKIVSIANHCIPIGKTYLKEAKQALK